MKTIVPKNPKAGQQLCHPKQVFTINRIGTATGSVDA
jgi:hypothetical protein